MLPIIFRPKQRKYIFRDQFITDRNAGAVNGTLAEPGPGTRVINDTSSKLTIGSGSLNVAAGSAVYTGVWFGSVVGAAGRILQAEIVAGPSKNSDSTSFGFDSNQSGSIGTRLSFGGGDLFIYDGAGTKYGLYVEGETYKVAVVVGNAWHYFFVKGGIYTNWTFVGRQTTSLGTVYPAANVQFAGSRAAINSLSVPIGCWVPTPLAYDTFTQADGALGNSDSLGPDSAGLTPKLWTGATYSISTNKAINSPPALGGELSSGTLTIGSWYAITATEVNHFFVGCAVGNTFRATAATALDANNKVTLFTLSDLFASVSLGVADVVNSVKVTLTAGTQAGMVINLDSAVTPANFILCYHDGTNVHLVECVAGVYSADLINTVAAYSAGKTLTVQRYGTKCRVIYNDATIGAEITMTANVNTLHGLFSTTNNSFVNFLSLARGSGGEYSALDSVSPMGSVINVPDGADLEAYYPLIKPGDILRLSHNGSYTLTASDGGQPIPSGTLGHSTIIDGNGSTLTGGGTAILLASRSYIELNNLNFIDQTALTIKYNLCHHIIQRNNTYLNTTHSGTFNDFNKILASDDCNWYNCTVKNSLTPTDSSDGFELWGPCNRINFYNCVVEGIAGPNPLTNINHGFEIYGQAAGQECVDVLIWHCQSSNCSRGVYAGGEDAGHFAIHTGVVMDGCTYSGNTISDIAGLHGTTVYVDNHTTDPAVEGSVTIRS